MRAFSIRPPSHKLHADARALIGVLGAAGLALGAGQSGASTMEGFNSGSHLAANLPVTSFYTPPDLNEHKAGDLLRFQPIEAPEGSDAWRILYVSKDAHEALVATSGVVVMPHTARSRPSPVLAWAHGTTGGAKGCAPSLSSNPDQRFRERGWLPTEPVDSGVPYLDDFLSRGDIVVAPDYVGLGAPGVHPYLVGKTAAENLFDAVRAAGFLPGVKLDGRMTALGWSQGGQAVLFAGETASTYAPEFKLLGVAAIAPAATTMHAMVDQMFRSDTPHVYEIVRGYAAAYNLMTPFLTPRGQMLVDAAGQGCILSVFDKISAAPGVGVIGDITGTPGWAAAFSVNQAGSRRSEAPVLIVHGAKDGVVLPAGTTLYRERACSVGTALQIEWLDDADHRSAIPRGRNTILSWLDGRLAGTPLKAMC